MGKSLRVNFGVYLVKTFVTALVPIIAFPYASHILGVDGIGRVTFAQSVASYFEMLALLGISQYATREATAVRKDPEKLGKLVTELLIVNTATTIFSVGLYLITVFMVSGLFNYRVLLLLFIVEIFAKGMNLEWLYSALEDYIYISKRSVVFQLISIALLFVLVRTQQDQLGYAVFLLLPYALSALINIVHAFQVVNIFGYKNYHFLKHLKGMLSVFAISVSSSVYMMLDTTMLGAMCGDTQVGLYTAASKLTKMGSSLVSSMFTVFLPRLTSYRYERNTEAFEKMATLVCNVILAFCIPVAAGMIALSREGILIFSGADFLAAQSSMKILAIDFIFSSINGFVAWQILMPYNEEKAIFRATATGAILDFLFNMALIPWMGSAGAATATLAAEICIFCVLLYYARRYIKIKNIMINLWQYIVGAIFIGVEAMLVARMIPQTLVCICVAVLICLPSYVLILILLKNSYALWGYDMIKQWVYAHK